MIGTDSVLSSKKVIIMDYSLDIIISKDDFDMIGFREKTFYWEDHELSLSPREFIIDNSIVFIEMPFGTMYNILTKKQ